MTEIESRSAASQSPHRTFWTGKHAASTVILMILALIAAYLQYSVYPSIMTATNGYGFGLKNVSLKFSFLTFQYAATRCTYSSCVRQVGIPSFDFFQAIVLVIVLMNLLHLHNVRKTS